MPIDDKVLVCCTGEGFLCTLVVGGLLSKLKESQEWGLNN